MTGGKVDFNVADIVAWLELEVTCVEESSTTLVVVLPLTTVVIMLELFADFNVEESCTTLVVSFPPSTVVTMLEAFVGIPPEAGDDELPKEEAVEQGTTVVVVLPLTIVVIVLLDNLTTDDALEVDEDKNDKAEEVEEEEEGKEGENLPPELEAVEIEASGGEVIVAAVETAALLEIDELAFFVLAPADVMGGRDVAALLLLPLLVPPTLVLADVDVGVEIVPASAVYALALALPLPVAGPCVAVHEEEEGGGEEEMEGDRAVGVLLGCNTKL